MVAGVSEETLDAIVAAGFAGRKEAADPVYSFVEETNRQPPVPPTGPAREPQTVVTSVEQRILGVLADGTPRSARDIAAALTKDGSFIAQREISRDVMRVLPQLRASNAVKRLVYEVYDSGTPIEVARFVDAATVGPVCLSCYSRWAADERPPRGTGFPAETCLICGRSSKDGTYVPIGEIEERRA